MKSSIKYLDAETKEVSNCGYPLEIEISSKDLHWDGVLLEKGWSPQFNPQNIITEYFYFALSLSSPLKWKATTAGKSKELHSEPGEIWLNPPNTAFSHNVDESCFFIILLISPQGLFSSFSEYLPNQKLSFLNQYNINDQTLANIIQLFYEEVKNDGRNGKVYFDTLKKLISNYFLKNYSNYQEIISNIENTAISENMLESIDKYIVEHMDENILIDTLALLFVKQMYRRRIRSNVALLWFGLYDLESAFKWFLNRKIYAIKS